MLSQFPLSQQVKAEKHILPASRTVGTVDGTGIDTNGYDAICFAVDFGVIAASTTLDVKIQEGETSTPTTDISGAAIVQLAAGTGGGKALIDVLLGGLKTRKRYLRADSVVGGSGAAVYGVTYQLYRAKSVPVTQTIAAVAV